MSSVSEELPDAVRRPWFKRPLAWIGALVGLLVGWLAFQGGVHQDLGGQATGTRGSQGRQHGQELLASALSLLHELGKSNSPEISVQVADRLNQWLATQPSDPAWRADPLLDTLPVSLRDFPGAADLGSTKMLPLDDDFLRQCLWMRSISQRVRGQDIDALTQTTYLLDWTVRNIQVIAASSDNPDDPDNAARLPLSVPQILMIGRGVADRRGWCLVLLARQQSLDMAMLALGDADQPEKLRPWLPALLHEGQLYLFDPWLGLPIPGPGGQGIATLEQAAADDSLLRQLDLDADHPYPIKSIDLTQVVALVEASPASLSRRMQIIESQLAGDEKLVLSSSASAQADRLRACRHVADVRLWTMPFESYQFQRHVEALRNRPQEIEKTELPILSALGRLLLPFETQPSLGEGRMLHFLGNFTGEHEEFGERSANSGYRQARPSDRELEYLATHVTKQRLRQFGVPPDQMEQVAPKIRAEAVNELQLARQHASYFLGLAAYERGQYETATDYFQKRTLDAYPDGLWTNGARFNLAQCYEALGQPERAAELYEADTSLQRHGNLLRAKRLRAALPAAAS